MSVDKRIEEIIGSIKQTFQCPICLELMVNPVSTKCDHKFCRQCMLKVIDCRPSVPCPLCKVSVTRRSLQDLVEWKKLVDKVNQLMEAFKLDQQQQLSGGSAGKGKGSARPNETGKEFRPNRETEFNGFPQKSTACSDGNQNNEGLKASLAGKGRHRSVRFQIDGDVTNEKQDSTEKGKVSGVCVESSPAMRSNRKRETIYSNREGSSSESGTVLNLHNDIGVDDLSSGLRKYGDNLQELAKPAIGRDNKIFKSRSTEMKDQAENEEIVAVDDPYAFLGSQSQKTKKPRGKQRQVDDLSLFEDPAKFSKRVKRSGRSGLPVSRPLNSSRKSDKPCGSDKNELEEIEALSHQITEAEAYDLVLSQQLRCTEFHKQDQSTALSGKDRCQSKAKQSSLDGEFSTGETSNSCQVLSLNVLGVDDNAPVSDIQPTSFSSETSDRHGDEAKHHRVGRRKRKNVKSNKKSAANGTDPTGSTKLASIEDDVEVLNDKSLSIEEDKFSLKPNSQDLAPLNVSIVTCVPDSVENDEEDICDKEDAGASPSSDDVSKNDNINQEKVLKFGNEDGCSPVEGDLDQVVATKRDYSRTKRKAVDCIDTEDICYPSVEAKEVKVGRKRKTFLLDTSPVSKDGFCGLVTESIDVEFVIGEAVQGILDQKRKEKSGEDDLSTQEVEKQEMILSIDDKETNLKHDDDVDDDDVIVGEENVVNRLSKSRGLEVHDEFGSLSTEKEKLGRRLVKDTPGKVENDEYQPSYRCTVSSKPQDPQNSLIHAENSDIRHSKGVIDLEKQDGVNSSGDFLSADDNNSLSLLQPPVSAVTIDKVCAVLASNKSPAVVNDDASSAQVIYSGSCEFVESSETLEREVGVNIVTEMTKTEAASQEASDNSTKSLATTADPDKTNSDLRAVEENLDSCGSDFESGVSGKLKKTTENHHSLSNDLSRSAKEHVSSISSEIPMDNDLLNPRSKESAEPIAIKEASESLIARQEVDDDSGGDDDGDIVETLALTRTRFASSGAASCESEFLTTQQRVSLEAEVKTMEAEIARLQAELKRDVRSSCFASATDVTAKETTQRPVSPSQVETLEKSVLPSQGAMVLHQDIDVPEQVSSNGEPCEDVQAIQDSPDKVHSKDVSSAKVPFCTDGKTRLADPDSSSEEDLFGSQVSDIVAIPQTPTPKKLDSLVEPGLEEMSHLRSPTPPPPLREESTDSIGSTTRMKSKRLKVRYSSDEASPDKQPKKVNNSSVAPDTPSLVTSKETRKESDLPIGFTSGKQRKNVISSSIQLPKQDFALSFPQKKDWVLVASGINRNTESPFVEEFTRRLGCRFSQKFINGTTHVLVKTVKEGSRRCQRTLKYFQGIASRCWVVSVEWIIDSIAMDCLQPEEKYEITGDVVMNEDHFGPTNARLSGVLLLRKYEICCLGAFDDLTRDDLRGLAEECGASSLQDPAMFSFDINRTQLIIVEGSSSESSHRHFEKLYKKFGVAIVAKEWLLDSVGAYNVKSLDEYAIYQPPS